MTAVRRVENFVGGVRRPPCDGAYMDVTQPTTGLLLARIPVSTKADVDAAVAAAKAALPAWRRLTCKARAAKLRALHALIEQHADALADLVVLESGKTKPEALAGLAKGNETCDWAIGLPAHLAGRCQTVSRGVACRDQLEPVGVVASIAPFNFPFMVPFWTTPIALACGNCVVLKPSEKCPLTMDYVATLLQEAGFPDGVFSLVHGARAAVEALCDAPDVGALTFVGSSPVAELVYHRCSARNKKCLALGGAKNHLVAMPDCDVAMAAADIAASFTGCAGQRCMAASVLLTVGTNAPLLEALVRSAAVLTPGVGAGNVGAVIDGAAQSRILQCIDEAEAGGATILLDGRPWADAEDGFWVGPTILLHTNAADAALHEEIFGPVLSVLVVDDKEAALRVENASPYGNAACVYTSAGGTAQWFADRFLAGMIGVNIGVPVPREPFTFGGRDGTRSKFGAHDVTGEGAMRFFTTRRKVTTKWQAAVGPPDKAQF